MCAEGVFDDMQFVVIDDFADLFAVAHAGVFDILNVVVQRLVGAHNMCFNVFFLQQSGELIVFDQEPDLILQVIRIGLEVGQLVAQVVWIW